MTTAIITIDDLHGNTLLGPFASIDAARDAAWAVGNYQVCIAVNGDPEAIVVAAITYRSSLGDRDVTDAEVQAYVAALQARLDYDDNCIAYRISIDADGDVIERVAWTAGVGGDGYRRLQHHGEVAQTQC